MRKAFLAILLVAFIAIAVFGFLAMGHGGDGHVHGGCIAATARGNACEADALDFFFHIGIFKSFSQAMVGGAMILIALLVFLLGMARTVSHTLRLSVFRPPSLWDALRYRIRMLSGIVRYRARAYFVKWYSLQRGDADYALRGVHDYASVVV